jgi:hypothetical protein
VYLYTPDGKALFSDNYFHLEKGGKKVVTLTEGTVPADGSTIRVKSLYDIQALFR